MHLYYLNIRKIEIFLKVANLFCKKRKNRLHIQSDMRIKFNNQTKSDHSYKNESIIMLPTFVRMYYFSIIKHN